MAKNVQLYDYTGTTKLYPTTVAQEVFLDGEQVSTILTDQNTVILDHEERITELEVSGGGSGGGLKIVEITRAEYNSLDFYEADTIYAVID